LFAGGDPFYYAPPTGLVDVRVPSLVGHGVAAPSYVSREFLAGVDDSIRNAFICTNCPNLTDNLRDYEPYLYVEPTTGKVLGGNKRAQFHAHIGQDEIFGNESTPEQQYRLVPDVYMPIFMMEDAQMFEQPQADQVTDGLDAISTAQIIQEAALIAGSVLAGLSIIGALVLLNHWRVLKQEERENWADADEYNGLPSDRGNETLSGSSGNFGGQHVQHTPY